MVTSILALDVGHKRVGVGIARAGLNVAMPLTTLDRQSKDFWQELADVIKNNDVEKVIVGLPRGLDGQETAQTLAAKDFGKQLKTNLKQPIVWQDEALTSVKAEGILRANGKHYQKGDIDALAASLILTDYLETR